MIKKGSKLKGFTLVELIVVIAIIGVLAAMLVPNMMGYIRKSKYTKANANAKSIYNMLASSAVDLDLSGNNLGSFKINKTDMEDWIDSLNLSKSREEELNRQMGGYIAMSYEGGYPKIVAWGENDASGAVIGRYPNPTNDTMYVTWDNVFSDWNNKSND